MMPNQKQLQPDQASNAVSWQQHVMQPYNAIAGQLKEILSGGLLTTTLLLQFIWFTNALVYYGLVLLTTSVSPPLGSTVMFIYMFISVCFGLLPLYTSVSCSLTLVSLAWHFSLSYMLGLCSSSQPQPVWNHHVRHALCWKNYVVPIPLIAVAVLHLDTVLGLCCTMLRCAML